MKPNPIPLTISIVLAYTLLAACSAQEAAAPAQPSTMPEPSVTTPPPMPASTTAAGESAMSKRAPGDITPPMRVFRAFGTEPFWNINVEEATLTLTTPEDQQGMVMEGERRNLPEGAEITGTHDGKPFSLKVTAGECSDGMSDNQYQLVSSFRLGDIDYKGCGEAAK